MGMYDHYEPVPPMEIGGEVLSGWQGKKGPCRLLVWRQLSAAPVSQGVDQKWRLPQDQVEALRLPDGEAEIYADHKGRWLEAIIVVRQGVWTETRLISGDEERA